LAAEATDDPRKETMMTAPAMMAPPLASQVGSVDHPAIGPLFERVRHEAMTVPDPCSWVTSYGDYQSGGWGTLSLLSDTGDARNVTISDADPVPTRLLSLMPATADLIGRLGLSIWWARLALMAPDSYLWEHRDYTEPGLADTDRHRIHLPLVTSRASFLVTEGRAVHMAAGKLWRLTPTYAHGACNTAGPTRIHLILDCHADDALSRLRAVEKLPADFVRDLPTAAPAELTEHVARARRLADLGYPGAAERHLLRLYFARALPREGHAYDLIAEMYDSLDDHAAAAMWRDRKALVLLGKEEA
jgi:hypothetical protein